MDKIVDTIFQAIDDVNATLPKAKRLTKTPDTIIFDSSNGLDSLALTIFVVGLEQKIVQKFGTALTLTNAQITSDENSPFRTVDVLAQYISRLLSHQTSDGLH